MLIYLLFYLHASIFVTPLDIDDCLSQPCENGATCVDDVHHVTCDCPFGFEGAFCDRGKTFLN